jgi:glutamate synthase domain-containing protein 2
VLEYVGIPTLSAVMEGLDALDEIGATGMPVVLMGGVKDGIDTAKALALGAHAVAMGTSAIIAGGCIACLQCAVGQCPVGIATPDPYYEQRYDIDVEAWNIHRFLESVRWQLASVVHAHGYDSVYQLGRDDLVALTPEAAAITRLDYAPDLAEQRRELTLR